MPGSQKRISCSILGLSQTILIRTNGVSKFWLDQWFMTRLFLVIPGVIELNYEIFQLWRHRCRAGNMLVFAYYIQNQTPSRNFSMTFRPHSDDATLVSFSWKILYLYLYVRIYFSVSNFKILTSDHDKIIFNWVHMVLQRINENKKSHKKKKKTIHLFSSKFRRMYLLVPANFRMEPKANRYDKLMRHFVWSILLLYWNKYLVTLVTW